MNIKRASYWLLVVPWIIFGQVNAAEQRPGYELVECVRPGEVVGGEPETTTTSYKHTDFDWKYSYKPNSYREAFAKAQMTFPANATSIKLVSTRSDFQWMPLWPDPTWPSNPIKTVFFNGGETVDISSLAGALVNLSHQCSATYYNNPSRCVENALSQAGYRIDITHSTPKPKVVFPSCGHVAGLELESSKCTAPGGVRKVNFNGSVVDVNSSCWGYTDTYWKKLPNTPPTASNRTLSTPEDTAGVVTLVATDLDGDALTYTIVAQPSAAHGTVTLSGNKLTFTPKPNWNGTTTLTYRATDPKGANSNTATVTVTVTPVNDSPSVANASLAIDEDTVGTLTLGVTDVDLQFEGDSHTWSIVTAPNAAHGTASITGNKLTFTPAKDWNGTTTLTYRARDSKGANSNTATITITVRPVNDAPIASNRTLTVAEDTAGTVTLLATDVDGDALTYSLVTAPNSAHGTVTISGDKATFTPRPNWNGTTTFTYRANDGKANSNTATVTVTVTPVNDAPVGMTPLTIRTIEGRTVEVKVTVLPN
ncbi:TPA: tandem-95 repeat protein [Pseudomonas aeruginosa]|nr:tandem-95 repeat protein [Pseudomonas aeruginosa]